MYLHANAKLGLAGRRALVRAVEDGLSLKAAAAVFNVSPATVHRCGDCASVVASLAGSWRGGAAVAVMSAGSLESTAPLTSRARELVAGADLCLPPRDRLGSALGRGRDWLRSLDGLEGAAAPRHLSRVSDFLCVRAVGLRSGFECKQC